MILVGMLWNGSQIGIKMSTTGLAPPEIRWALRPGKRKWSATLRVGATGLDGKRTLDGASLL